MVPTLPPLAPLTWVGSSRKDLRAMGKPVTDKMGAELQLVQLGLDPTDWKPMTGIGAGVREVCVTYRGEFRIIYVVLAKGRPAVLHAFRKKSQQTSKRDIEIARR